MEVERRLLGLNTTTTGKTIGGKGIPGKAHEILGTTGPGIPAVAGVFPGGHVTCTMLFDSHDFANIFKFIDSL